MRLLLDTHVWIWVTDPATGQLDPAVHALIEDGANDVVFSAASAWEIAIKCALGKLKLPAPPEDFVPEHVARASMTWLPIGPAHALRVATLPHYHRDPFDRLLVAQALMEGLRVVTADPTFRRYGVEVIEATAGARKRPR
jgi:PIN domain nuclease of toxin-antitoxin system